MDVVDYIKQVKRKKLEKDLVVRETCTRFGLSVDEALVAFDELTERGILTTQEDSVVVDGKEKIELTKNLFKAWQESSSRESTVACTIVTRESCSLEANNALLFYLFVNIFLVPSLFEGASNFCEGAKGMAEGTHAAGYDQKI